ncbi:MAG: amidohydrolase family protein [Gemmatimonadetes bacterium]|nr:amidohydrolase family protein [Gemmatimonadota bacterium]
MRLPLLPLTALLVGLTAPLGSQVPAAPPLAILGATLWDGTGAPAVPDAVVLVQDGTVTCAGTRRACPVPRNATRVDATGRWLLPGLIDTHVHLLFRVGGRTDPSLRTDLRDLLARGITTVRDMGTNPSRLREEVDSAGPAAPRVFAMQLVAGIRFFGPERERTEDGFIRMHAPQANGMRQLGWFPLMLTTASEAPEVVQKAIAGGAIGLKLYQDLDSAQVAALVQAAHAVGMPVWGHAWVQPASVLEQATAGQDGVVHAAGLVGELLDHYARDSLRTSSYLLRITADSATGTSAHAPAVLAALDTLAARGTFLEPTLHVAELSARRAGAHRRPVPTLPDRYALAAGTFGVAVTREAVARGVRLTAGTDHTAYGPPSERAMLTEELRLFVDSLGLAPARALLAATRDAAIAIGPVAKDLGTIAPGKRADLLLLRADPLADITNLTQVEWVMREGVPRSPRDAVPPPP